MINLTQRQNEIVNESISIILEYGMQNLTIKNISKAMGFTEGAIYRHFASKKVIISSIGELIIDIYEESIKNLDIDNDSFLERLHNFEEKWADIVINNKELIPLFFAYKFIKFNKEQIEKIEKVQIKFKKHLVEVIEGGKANGEFNKDLDSLSASTIIIGTIRNLSSNYISEKTNLEIHEALKENWSTLKKIFI